MQCEVLQSELRCVRYHSDPLVVNTVVFLDMWRQVPQGTEDLMNTGS
jgi:hypothetical protein